MANVSRNVPPCAAVITIRPAAGGPSSTTFHSSGEKAALVVMACSCAAGDAATSRIPQFPGRALHPAGVRPESGSLPAPIVGLAVALDAHVGDGFEDLDGAGAAVGQGVGGLLARLLAHDRGAERGLGRVDVDRGHAFLPGGEQEGDLLVVA